jgi:hypothetical protein
LVTVVGGVSGICITVASVGKREGVVETLVQKQGEDLKALREDSKILREDMMGMGKALREDMMDMGKALREDMKDGFKAVGERQHEMGVAVIVLCTLGGAAGLGGVVAWLGGNKKGGGPQVCFAVLYFVHALCSTPCMFIPCCSSASFQ